AGPSWSSVSARCTSVPAGYEVSPINRSSGAAAMLDGVGQGFQLDSEVDVFDIHPVRHVQLHRREIQDRRHAGRHEPIDERLRWIGGGGPDRASGVGDT